jgi:hypothetical protein
MLLDRTQRPWILACLAVLAVATAAYVPYHLSALPGPSGGSWPGLMYGGAGLALMLYAAVLGARRTVPTWRLGRATTWMSGHVWLGLLSLPLILFHSGFQLGGPLTLVLMILFVVVVGSGVFGVAVQQFLPRLMLEEVPLETVYEQIDAVVAQLRAEADEMVGRLCGPLPVAAAAAPAGRRAEEVAARPGRGRPPSRPEPATATVTLSAEQAAALRDLYLREIRPFLDRTPPRDAALAAPARATALFQHLRTALPPSAHPALGELEEICDERRQLARQKRLHHWLHGWLLVHVPLSMALILLALVHAVMALRY